MIDLDRLDFARSGGVVSVVAQDDRSRRVLMVAAADREALERTLATGEMHYRSRTRGLWHKGATSGHTQRVVSLTPDCDGDAILARVVSNGPACHRGTGSCFDGAGAEPAGTDDVLHRLDRLIGERMSPAPGAAESPGYTRSLLGDRNLRLKKLGEESAELVLACADGDRARAVEEAADVVYHLLVAVRAVGGNLNELLHALEARGG